MKTGQQNVFGKLHKYNRDTSYCSHTLWKPSDEETKNGYLGYLSQVLTIAISKDIMSCSASYCLYPRRRSGCNLIVCPRLVSKLGMRETLLTVVPTSHDRRTVLHVVETLAEGLHIFKSR